MMSSVAKHDVFHRGGSKDGTDPSIDTMLQRVSPATPRMSLAYPHHTGWGSLVTLPASIGLPAGIIYDSKRTDARRSGMEEDGRISLWMRGDVGNGDGRRLAEGG